MRGGESQADGFVVGLLGFGPGWRREMRQVDTEEIMRIALDLGGFSEVPADSGIWFEGRDLRRVLVGIDVGPAELKIGRDLGFDAVIAHHPVRRAGFWKVFERHREMMRTAGVPEAVIAEALDGRAAALRLSEHNSNDDHVVSIARLLALPFLNVHLPLDEFTRLTIVDAIARRQAAAPDASVAEVAAAIGDLPSFRRSTVQPLVAYGNPDRAAGRVVVSIAAGTNGGFPVAAAYLRHAADTVVYMHVDPSDLDHLARENVPGALIITGHMPGDNVGIDAFVQELRRRGLQVETFSGVDTPLE